MEDNYLLLIDGSSLLSTQYYGNLPRELMFAKSQEEREAYYGKIMHTSTGIYTNAIYGFMRTLIKIIKMQKPSHIAVAWDISRNTFRREIDKDYKGTRNETPEPLKDQFKLCQEILKEMNIMQFMDSRYEADDFCGSLSTKFENEIPVRILTKDNDYLQLVTKNTRLWLMFTTEEKANGLFKKYKLNKDDYNIPDKAFELTEKLVKEEFGIKPCQVPDLKSLVGDKSDNIKGVSGVGEASAVPLISYYGSVEKLYEAIENLDKAKEKEIKELWKSELSIKRSPLNYLLKTSDTEIVGKESAFISKKLAIIKKDIGISETLDDLKININLEKAQENFDKLEFKSLSIYDITNEPLKELNSNLYDDISCILIDSLEKMKNIFKDFNKTSENTNYYINYSTENNNLYTKASIKNLYIFADINCHEELKKVYNVDFQKISNEDNEKAVLELKNFFEDENKIKIIHDGKSLLNILHKNNILIKSFNYDTAIAAYILDSSKSEYNLDHIIKEYLNVNITEDLLNKTAYFMKQIYEITKSKIKEEKMEKLFYEVEMPLIYVLSSMETEGFRVDSETLKELQSKFTFEIQKTQNEIYSMAEEEFNINSPKQLGKILFEKLDLPVIKKTKTGYSTNADVLEKLKGKHEIIEKIIYYRQITKLNSTYVEGLQSVIDGDNKIHSTFNQTVTTTGRLSSTDPNLQNIPIKYEMGREIRKVFIPEEKGDMILSCDYSQIELRVLAHIANDKNMIDSFKHHSDIHTKTASEVFNVDIDSVTKLMRSRAKAVNFGIVYGMGAFSLSQDLKITKKEAEMYINIYLQRYPEIKKYLDDVVKFAEQNGYVETILNRRRFIPEIKSSNKIVKALGERLAKNAPIQGSAADIIKIAMINVYNRLNKEKLKSKLILQVHDELILNVKKDEIDKVKNIVEEEMMDAAKLKVKLEVDMNMGSTWYEVK